MKIGILGAGRLGICFALLLEKSGYEVVASDIREEYIKDLQKKVIHTHEPSVQELLKNSKNITFKVGNQEVIEECDIIFTFVATPSLPDGSYDVSAFRQVIKDIKNCPFEVKGKSLIVGCTTNPGDCNDFQNHLKEHGIDIYYNPEFIAQGSIVKDLQFADMVLIGGEGKHLQEIEKMYHRIQITEPSIHILSTTAAELVKLALNCFLTTKISYANMIGEVMTLSGLNSEIEKVLNAIGSDTRVGNKFLKYGYGYGGPCLPRDNRSFAAYAKKVGLEYNLGFTTDNFNEEHSKFLLKWYISKNKSSLPFAFKSVAYKEGTDIITESQQYKLCLNLLNSDYNVYVVDETVKDQCDSRIIWGEPEEEVYWIEL